MRGVTISKIAKNYENCISTHTPHARRDIKKYDDSEAVEISTHTPHARRDVFTNGIIKI